MSSINFLDLARTRAEQFAAARTGGPVKQAITTPPAANDAAITVPCSRCGTRSRPFIEIVNPDGWLCDGCWPAWPDDAAYEQEERAAIMSGAAPVVVLHQMPPSWSDATIEPTAGARCRCCSGSKWWTEATSPKGWRCTTCYGHNHLLPSETKDLMT